MVAADWISIIPVESCSRITSPSRESVRAAIKYTSGAPGALTIPLGRVHVHWTTARAPGHVRSHGAGVLESRVVSQQGDDEPIVLLED